MRNKVILIGGGLVLAIVLLIVFKSLTKDTFRPKLNAVSVTNSEITSLSTLAAAKLTDFGVQVANANVTSVTTTDSAYLATYYKTAYHAKLPGLPKTFPALTSLSTAANGDVYDQTYQSGVHDLLQTNLSALKQLLPLAVTNNLKAVLNQLISDETALIKQVP